MNYSLTLSGINHQKYVDFFKATYACKQIKTASDLRKNKQKGNFSLMVFSGQ